MKCYQCIYKYIYIYSYITTSRNIIFLPIDVLWSLMWNLLFHYSNVWELRGVHWAANQDEPAEDCYREAKREKHQWCSLLGPETQHNLSPDSQADKSGKVQTQTSSFVKCSLLIVCTIGCIKQVRVVFITLFNHAFQVSSIKYLAKPLSTFHQINAYEEDGFLIIDMCASDDGQAISNFNIQNLRKSGEALDEVSKPSKGQNSTSSTFHACTASPSTGLINCKWNTFVAFGQTEQ